MSRTKACPYCGASVEEEARFCLYCMTPLNKKTLIEPKKTKKRWLLPAAVFVVLLAFTLLLILLRRPQTPTSSTSSPTPASSPAPTATAVPTDTSSVPATAAPTAAPAVDPTDIPTPTVPATDTPSATPPAAPTVDPTFTPTSTALPTVPTTDTPTATPTPTPTPTPTATPAPSASPTPTPHLTPTYGYRVSGGEAVITSVTLSSDGIYVIPDTLDGYPVIAVAETGFSEVAQTVKKIVLPSSVRSVYGRAFKTCCNLSDLYLCGEKVSMADYALPSVDYRTTTVTIHCSSTCENDAYRRYCNIASYDFGALYDEWDESEGY